MVIRVNKTDGFTVMSNFHLRDKRISLKAKGLLSVMLSLPESWDYSIAGLVAICKENETAVKSALDELRKIGYLIVTKKMPGETKSGRIEYEYDVYEQPRKKQGVEKQGLENLPLEIQGVEIQGVENQGQLNTKELSTKELNTKEVNTDNRDIDSAAALASIDTTHALKNAHEDSTKTKSKKQATKHKYGEYNNVLLTDAERDKLLEEFPHDFQERIDRLSGYIESTGKKYKSHYATIRNWARNDKAKTKTASSRYCVGETDYSRGFEDYGE